MFHFTLRHKAGATFGPDGLSRRPKQPGDPKVEPCSDDEDNVIEPLQYEVGDPSKPQPLAIEEFVDQIDSHGGYFYGIATSLEDFSTELEKADKQWVREKQGLQNK